MSVFKVIRAWFIGIIIDEHPSRIPHTPNYLVFPIFTYSFELCLLVSSAAKCGEATHIDHHQYASIRSVNSTGLAAVPGAPIFAPGTIGPAALFPPMRVEKSRKN